MTENEIANSGAARRRALTVFMLGAPLLAAGCASRGSTQEDPEPPIEFPVEWFSDSTDVPLNATLQELRQRLPFFGRCRVFRKFDLGTVRVPVAATFKGSESLTALAARDLSARGLNVTAAGEPASATLVIDGAVSFNGRFGPIPPAAFGALYEAAQRDGMQTATRAWVTATAFGGQPGAAVTSIVIGEVLGRLLGSDHLVRLFTGLDAATLASGRRLRANYLAYGDARGRCMAGCDSLPWFVVSAVCSATLKANDSEKSALVSVTPAARRVDAGAALALAYGLLVRDGLQLGAERWIDQLVDPKPAQAPQEEAR